MKPIVISLLASFAVATVLLAALTTSQDKIDRPLLVGIWIDRNCTPAPGDRKPRMEFAKNGRFRSMNQVGEISHGTWKWTSRDTVAITDPKRDRVTSVRIIALSGQKLVTATRGSTEMVRATSWDEN